MPTSSPVTRTATTVTCGKFSATSSAVTPLPISTNELAFKRVCVLNGVYQLTVVDDRLTGLLFCEASAQKETSETKVANVEACWGFSLFYFFFHLKPRTYHQRVDPQYLESGKLQSKNRVHSTDDWLNSNLSHTFQTFKQSGHIKYCCGIRYLPTLFLTAIHMHGRTHTHMHAQTHTELELCMHPGSLPLSTMVPSCNAL